ncbi:uncharacterized protein K460DRAFT_33182 [Cucurbitaria berberidis CBS 394.84]|uniref:Uncharacterized protein n=1 Tax=Cucurbitaria berberidis CBS 394.84 TaxID=1168544 RepID=A0A9P4GRH1_9PLEO|nr:uncharacterized protein K460DRAFT_33182 [Cucurbitaria berberidis CBS 394.84]KAF1851373.1 hypothetical protein K460DRAFT_33182 [Cucurbitaria berberidis CBS 394.84]
MATDPSIVCQQQALQGSRSRSERQPHTLWLGAIPRIRRSSTRHALLGVGKLCKQRIPFNHITESTLLKCARAWRAGIGIRKTRSLAGWAERSTELVGLGWEEQREMAFGGAGRLRGRFEVGPAPFAFVAHCASSFLIPRIKDGALPGKLHFLLL